MFADSLVFGVLADVWYKGVGIYVVYLMCRAVGARSYKLYVHEDQSFIVVAHFGGGLRGV